MLRAFCRPHAYTFSEQSKTAIALTPQTDITSEKVMASLQKMKLIKKHRRVFFFLVFFIKIKSQTSDSFVNHFDGHFAYLKTLDFSFKDQYKVDI